MAACAAGFAVMAAACHKEGGSPMSMPPSEVSVVPVAVETVRLTTELPGRINPVREAQVRARATGIVLKRRFEEGALVHEGDVLFEIDPEPLKAALDAAKAGLARATASLADAKAKAERNGELVKINAVSRQTLDESVAALGQIEADVLSGTAAVRTAELNLGYARVTAPITGRIGKALVTEGAYVSAAEATQMAVIRQLDPIFFDFTQSSAEMLRLRRAVEQGALKGAGADGLTVDILLEDGTTYGKTGRLLFSDVVVDPTTGMITLRADVPNPDGVLLPGMFCRARIVEGVETNALVIPLRALQRGPAGSTSVLVVGDGERSEARTVEVARLVDNRAVVAKGLKAGERIIVEGSQKAPPGAPVKAVPFVETPAKAN
jgi:membrane fusion protein, multidrug efflux system